MWQRAAGPSEPSIGVSWRAMHGAMCRCPSIGVPLRAMYGAMCRCPKCETSQDEGGMVGSATKGSMVVGGSAI